jgi:hypothetical protein
MPIVGLGYAGLKKETVFGTAVVVTDFIPVKSFEPAQDPQNYYPEVIRAGRSKTQGIPMGLQNEVSAEMDAEPQSLGHFLLAALGKVTSVANAGFVGSFDHSFVPANTLPSYTIEGSDGTMHRTMSGSKLDSLTLSIEAGGDGVLTMESEWKVKSITDKASASVPSYTDKKPFAFHKSTVTWGGSVNSNLTSFELEIGNNLKDDQFALTNSREVQSIDEGMREVSGSFEMRFKNKTDYLDFMAGTTEVLKIEFDGDLIGGTVSDKLVIDLPRIMFDSFEVPMGGPDDEVMASVEFTSLHDNTAGFEVKAILTNSVATY